MDIGKHMLLEFKAQYKNKLKDSAIKKYNDKDVMILSSEEIEMFRDYLNSIIDYHVLNQSEAFICVGQCKNILTLKDETFIYNKKRICKECFIDIILFDVCSNFKLPNYNHILDYEGKAVIAIDYKQIHEIISYVFKKYDFDISDNIVLGDKVFLCECGNCDENDLYDIEEMITVGEKVMRKQCHNNTI